jgi:hypothetical protein
MYALVLLLQCECYSLYTIDFCLGVDSDIFKTFEVV